MGKTHVDIRDQNGSSGDGEKPSWFGSSSGYRALATETRTLDILSLKARRLERYLLACASRSHSLSWFPLRMARIAGYLGISRASFFRALAEIREHSTDLGFRTLFDCSSSVRGAWKVIWTARPGVLTTKMLFFRDIHGRDRHLRLSLRNPNITPSESQSLVRETSSKWSTPEESGFGGRSPPAIHRKAWAVVRSLQDLHSRKQWKISFQAHRVYGWVVNALRKGLCADALIRGYWLEMDRVHAHNTDVWFSESRANSPLRYRGAAWMAHAAVRYATRQPTKSQSAKRSVARSSRDSENQ